jgi:recombinational DNA repair protein RecR
VVGSSILLSRRSIGARSAEKWAFHVFDSKENVASQNRLLASSY